MLHTYKLDVIVFWFLQINNTIIYHKLTVSVEMSQLNRNKNPGQGMNNQLPHSELYYSLIRSKNNSTISNSTNNIYKQTLLVPRGGGGMLSPDSQQEILNPINVETSGIKFKNTEEEIRIKQNLWVHLENIPLLQSAPMSQIWAEVPPPKMDSKKKYTNWILLGTLRCSLFACQFALSSFSGKRLL